MAVFPKVLQLPGQLGRDVRHTVSKEWRIAIGDANIWVGERAQHQKKNMTYDHKLKNDFVVGNTVNQESEGGLSQPRLNKTQQEKSTKCELPLSL